MVESHLFIIIGKFFCNLYAVLSFLLYVAYCTFKFLKKIFLLFSYFVCSTFYILYALGTFISFVFVFSTFLSLVFVISIFYLFCILYDVILFYFILYLVCSFIIVLYSVLFISLVFDMPYTYISCVLPYLRHLRGPLQFHFAPLLFQNCSNILNKKIGSMSVTE